MSFIIFLLGSMFGGFISFLVLALMQMASDN